MAETTEPTEQFEQTEHGEQARAGFGVRLAAALIDAALILPLYFALVKGVTWLLESGLVGREWRRTDPVFMSITLGNAVVLLYSLSEVLWAATPGKMLLRMRVRAADGAPATRAVLLARYALKHGARVCGLVDALSSIRHVRLLYAWGPVPIFRRQPLEFVTLRTTGELLWLAAVVGFFFVLGRRRQALYDLATKSAVYRPRSLGPAKRGFDPLPVLPAEPVLLPPGAGTR